MPAALPRPVDKPSSVLVLSPSLALARAFLLRFFEHCALPRPDLDALDWAAPVPWPISNKYYDAQVDLVLRQVLEESHAQSIEQNDAQGEGEGEEEDVDAGEEGYPGVLYLLPTPHLKDGDSYRIPSQVRQVLREEKPDVSVAFSLDHDDASTPLAGGSRADDEVLVEAFLEVETEYIAGSAAALEGVDNDHTPPPFEQLVQSLSSHMWPTMALKSGASNSSSGPRSSAQDTISALAGLLGGMGGFSLPSDVDLDVDDLTQGAEGSDFSDGGADDAEPDRAGYTQLDGSGDYADFGEFAAAPVDLDGEHRAAGLEFMGALASVDPGEEPEESREGWTTFGAEGSAPQPPLVQPSRNDSILASFGPPASLSLFAESQVPERKFSSTFDPSSGPIPVPSLPSRTPTAGPGDEDDPSFDLNAILSHLTGLRDELSGVQDAGERRRRAGEAVMALFGEDLGEGPEKDGP